MKSNRVDIIPDNFYKASFWAPINIILIFFIFLLGLDFQSSAQTTPKKALLALSKNDHVLAIIDPVSFKILAKIPVGSDPHEVTASADGKTAYVTIYGGGSLHEINIIDLIGQKPLPTLDIRPFLGPHGIMFADGKVWFTAEGAKAIARYDPSKGKIDWCLGTGQDRTHMIYVDPSGKKIYTTNVTSATVSILRDSLFQPLNFQKAFLPPNSNAYEDWRQTLVPVGKGSEGFDVSPDGKELWAAGADDGTISIINITTRKLTEKINTKVIGANRLKFTPDGKFILVTSLRNGDLFIFEAATHKEIKHLNTGHGAAGILVDTDGSRAFIGCTADNYVAVVNLKTFEITSHISVAGADGLAWAIQP